MIPDEQKIDTLDVGSFELRLTTHRLRLMTRVNNATQVTSIMLEELSYSYLSYKDNIIYLILAVLGLIGSVTAGIQLDGWYYLGILVTLVLVEIYYISRGGYLTFASSGGTIITRKFNRSPDEMLLFIDKVETAKNSRFLSNRLYQ